MGPTRSELSAKTTGKQGVDEKRAAQGDDDLAKVVAAQTVSI
jgi:hypothetical protein